jgi:hypothetical protein
VKFKLLLLVLPLLLLGCMKKNVETSQLADISKINWTEDQAKKFAGLSLECLEKAYPFKPGVVLYSKDDLIEPSKRHPIFYGCFDWHSAVHGHWALIKVLHSFPQISIKSEIITKIGNLFTSENFQKEADFFATKAGKIFERPYGIAWF